MCDAPSVPFTYQELSTSLDRRDEIATRVLAAAVTGLATDPSYDSSIVLRKVVPFAVAAANLLIEKLDEDDVGDN